MKKQSTKWEKILASQISDKSENPRYINSYNLVAKKLNSSIKNEQDKHFSKEDIEMANRYMKRCLASLIIEKMKKRP